MRKKNINIVKIKSPEIKKDGKSVRFDIVTDNNQKLSLTVKSNQLTALIEFLIQIHGSAKINEVFFKSDQSPIADYFSMPTPFQIKDINLVSFNETGAFSAEIKDLHGNVAHLHFLPDHLQFFVKVLEKTKNLPPSNSVH